MGCCLISAARLKGEAHTQCDDRIYFFRTEDISISVLADGAGSKKHSSVGAKIATKTLAKMLYGLLEKIDLSSKSKLLNSSKELKESIVVNIQNAIESNKSYSGNLQDYSSTLLFAAYIKKCNRWLIGHIGDGVVCGLDYKGNLMVISEPENGEFANETFFITDEQSARRFRLYLIKDLKGVLLISDGVSNSVYNKKNIASGLLNFFKWQRELGERKTSSILRKNIKEVFLKKTRDDCSIIINQIKEENLFFESINTKIIAL